MKLILNSDNFLCLCEGIWKYTSIMIMSHLLDIDFEKLCKIIKDCGGEICINSKYYMGYFDSIRDVENVIKELEPYLVMANLCRE